MKSLLASLALCLVLATGAKANCYVLQNNTDQEQKWGFSYNTSVGPHQIRNLTMAPHDHYPTEGQWCWNGVPWKAAVRVASGSYRRSWSGQLTMGDGEGASPSGIYSLEPVADAPPSPRSNPKAAAAPPSPPRGSKAAAAPARAQTAVPAGSAPSISCVDQVCGVLFQNGHVAYTDTSRPAANGVATIVGFKAPGSISCLPQAKQPGELCVVIDSTGQTWKGSLRPGGDAWAPWTKAPQH